MKPFRPQTSKLPRRTVLTVTTIGDPNTVTGDAMQALYGTAYGTKFKVLKPKREMLTVGPCSAYWPNAHLQPRSKWVAVWMLQVDGPITAKNMIQKKPKMPVKLERLPAATVAEVLYIGTYADEGPTIKQLHQYIADQGLMITGVHEEVYLSRPGPKAKTIIRYVVQKRRKQRSRGGEHV